MTIILSDQNEGAAVPVYTTNDIVNGFVSIHDPSDVLHVELIMEGYIRIREIAEGRPADQLLFGETLILWDAGDGGLPPVLQYFRRAIPTHYTDDDNKRHPLPPTYHIRLNGIPGFNVAVEYYLLLTVTRRAMLRQRTRRIRIPFLYRPRLTPKTYPPLPAVPFASPSDPARVFVGSMMPRDDQQLKPITVYLCLPSTRVCSYKEPIPFRIRLVGPPESLAPFMFVPPPESSIHPITPDGPLSQYLPSGPTETAKALKSLRGYMSKRQQCDLADLIRIRLDRQTFVLGETSLCADGQMSTVKSIGEGVIYETDRAKSWLGCSGRIEIHREVDCGSFVATRLIVANAVVLTIALPGRNSGRAPFQRYQQAVPIRLVADTEPARAGLTRMKTVHY